MSLVLSWVKNSVAYARRSADVACVASTHNWVRAEVHSMTFFENQALALMTFALFGAGCVSNAPPKTASLECANETIEPRSDARMTWCEADSGEIVGHAFVDHGPNGGIASFVAFADGKPVSTSIFHEDGSLRSVSLKDPLDQTELLITWYPNGRLKNRSIVRNDELTGDYQSWHETGKTSSRGAFQDGEKVGDWSYWDTNGALLRTERHRIRDVTRLTSPAPASARTE